MCSITVLGTRNIARARCSGRWSRQGGSDERAGEDFTSMSARIDSRSCCQVAQPLLSVQVFAALVLVEKRTAKSGCATNDSDGCVRFFYAHKLLPTEFAALAPRRARHIPDVAFVRIATERFCSSDGNVEGRPW